MERHDSRFITQEMENGMSPRLLIGCIEVKPALVLAPLHEITDLAFRTFIREIGGVGLTVSEMVSCEALIRKAHKAMAMLAGDGGHPFAVQIVGSRTEAMVEAAMIAEESGADIVDINMGCPASNITGGLAGSAMLRDIKASEQCLKAVKRAVRVPVTVKMRIGWDEAQKERMDYLNFLKMFEDNGIAAVTIHPRTRSQQFRGKADWSYIAKAKEQGMMYPIIGNGDIITPEDAEKMQKETGCDGVMIGRGAMYNPFIFKQVLDRSLCISNDDRIDSTIQFFELVMKLHDERESLHKIKKFCGLFTKGIPGISALRQRLNSLRSPSEIIKELKSFK
jgi:nifR3 family TIM-barrel protein